LGCLGTVYLKTTVQTFACYHNLNHPSVRYGQTLGKKEEGGACLSLTEHTEGSEGFLLEYLSYSLCDL